MAIGAAAAALVGRRTGGGRPLWWLAAPPLATYALWQVVLALHWGEAVGGSRLGAIGPPLAGFVGLLTDVADRSGRHERRTFRDLLLVAGFTLSVAVVAWRSRRAPGRDALAWLLASGLVFSLTGSVWVEDWGYLRAFTEPYLLGVLLLLGAPGRWSTGVLLGAWAWWGSICERLL